MQVYLKQGHSGTAAQGRRGLTAPERGTGARDAKPAHSGTERGQKGFVGCEGRDKVAEEEARGQIGFE